MPAPFLLVQLSDPHLGARWGGGDPAAALAAAVDAVLALAPAAAGRAVVVSGDLADAAADAEYAQVRELLAPLGAPVHVVAGNHDTRQGLRRHFAVPGAGAADAPVQYAVDAGPLRLVVADTTRPGEDAGQLHPERLGWLDAELAAAPDRPTVLAMHHPPLTTGLPVMDAVGLPEEDRRALAAVLARHPQVRRVVAGHVHRAVTADLAGTAVLAAPSTYAQARLDFEAQDFQWPPQPAGFAVHLLAGGDVVSHVQPVAA